MFISDEWSRGPGRVKVLNLLRRSWFDWCESFVLPVLIMYNPLLKFGVPGMPFASYSAFPFVANNTGIEIACFRFLGRPLSLYRFGDILPLLELHTPGFLPLKLTGCLDIRSRGFCLSAYVRPPSLVLPGGIRPPTGHISLHSRHCMVFSEIL